MNSKVIFHSENFQFSQLVKPLKSRNINNIWCCGGLAESLTAGVVVGVPLSVFCTELSNSCLGFLPH